MSSRRAKFDLQTTDPKKVIEVCIRYSKPDGSYAESRPEQQGYWVNMVPIELDGAFRIQTAYTGVKAFHEPSKRFSQKKLGEIEASVKHELAVNHTDDRYPTMLRNLLEATGLELKDAKERMERAKERARLAKEVSDELNG